MAASSESDENKKDTRPFHIEFDSFPFRTISEEQEVNIVIS